MLLFGSKPATLPLSIQQDPATGLPLLSQQDAVLQFVLAYLALPYSVTEYGCGKKASLIIDHLLELGIPAFAVSRLLVLERDMSPRALATTDPRRRSQSLVADNLLHQVADPADGALRHMLDTLLDDVDLDATGSIGVGPYRLHDAAQVQFESTRSHVSVVLWFWDDDNHRATRRVIDPSLCRDSLIPPEDLRDFLHAPEALVFAAHLLAHFRLLPELLTASQRSVIHSCLNNRELQELTLAEEHELVRLLTGAEKGSIGDPHTWTYANNLEAGSDSEDEDCNHHGRQALNSGRGDGTGTLVRRLLEARSRQGRDIPALLAQLRALEESAGVKRLARADARWSMDKLEPLADAATLFVYFQSLQTLAGLLRAGQDPLAVLEREGHNQAEESVHDDAYPPIDRTLQNLRGIGVRLRRRIDWLASCSRTEDGRLDARALTPGFVRATENTIRQMNQAGLVTFIDRVGNIHGLLVDRINREALWDGRCSPAEFCRRSLVHCSHIDTVNDAGKFDGRLGVLSGIETAHVLTDLERYFDLPAHPVEARLYTHVSAYIGEEMTFTGQGISMPGSGAVASRARPEQVHKMQNADGERFDRQLVNMLERLADAQRRSRIKLVNDLASARAEDLLAACSDPADFYSPHSYERHIEQGPVLDRAGVPVVMVGTIMGIHQEDFVISGRQAEAAALEFNRRLRLLTSEEPFNDVRITVGMIAGDRACEECETVATVAAVQRWTLDGELNHAGATPTADRRDPGVAAARLATRFRQWLQQAQARHSAGDQDQEKALQQDRQQEWQPNHTTVHPDLEPLVSDVVLTPGTNRNVIPAAASLTLALRTPSQAARDSLTHRVQEDLRKTLEGFVVGTLTRQVTGGGEGLRRSRVDTVGFASRFNRTCLSIDLRADSREVMTAFRERIDAICRELTARFGVTMEPALQQQLAPSHLARSGQALLMERSYGGSHNPRETELLSDILRGSMLQLGITRKLMHTGDPARLNLFDYVEKSLPPQWLARMPRFTSGALHDTCNIAATAWERQQRRVA